MPGPSDSRSSSSGTGGDRGRARSAAARIALKVSELHADLLRSLHEEQGENRDSFADAVERLAEEFGSVTATAVEALEGGARGPARPRPSTPEGAAPAPAEPGPEPAAPAAEPAAPAAEGLPSLYRPGHMRRRLDQLIESNRRYGHSFGLVVFDASGPGVREGDPRGGQETVLAILGAALRDSIRIVDEAFRLEEDAICVLAPNLRTVEGVQMAERLLALLDGLERAGGLRISISAGVVACPDHGTEAEQLLQKADAAMWRARALGQPVGVGALRAVQDR